MVSLCTFTDIARPQSLSVYIGFRGKTIDAFFLGSKEDKATHARLARIAPVSFSRRSPGNSTRLTQCSLRGTTFANNTHVPQRAHKSAGESRSIWSYF